MENTYSATIKFASKELSAKERIMLKDTTNAVALDEACEGSTVVIDPDFYAVLSVHNEKSKDKDYEKYIIVDKAGTKFVTGSASFLRSFKDIMDEMEGSTEEFQVEVYKKPSKNYSGKSFITCSII